MLKRVRSSLGRDSAVRVVSSDERRLEDAVAELKRLMDPRGLSQLLAFFSPLYDADALAKALDAAFPGIPLSGCSTAGEITPRGLTDGAVVLMGLPEADFRVATGLIEDIDQQSFERAFQISRSLRASIAGPVDRNLRESAFALMLVDGLSNCEERLVAAVRSAIHDVPLVGGSAGDDLAFRRTAVIHNGRAVPDAAVVILVQTDLEFRVFKSQNFEPTPTRLVVTSADVDKRIVYELNAEPAAREYAAAIGIPADDLSPLSFASHPVVVKVGSEYFCRSIRNVNPDGSLTFFCAIDEGLVLTVATPKNMVDSTRETLGDVDEDLGGISLVLGFDCVLRRLDAENHQTRRLVEGLYRDYHVIGFHTYGEQYNAMHLNQTLTGIAFGRRRAQL